MAELNSLFVCTTRCVINTQYILFTHRVVNAEYVGQVFSGIGQY